MHWSQTESSKWSLNCLSRRLGQPRTDFACFENERSDPQRDRSSLGSATSRTDATRHTRDAVPVVAAQLGSTSQPLTQGPHGQVGGGQAPHLNPLGQRAPGHPVRGWPPVSGVFTRAHTLRRAQRSRTTLDRALRLQPGNTRARPHPDPQARARGFSKLN